MLEDLVLAAVRDAVHQANAISQQAFGGLNLPGMPGMPGLPS
jgi:DNA-binding protein YbaB